MDICELIKSHRLKKSLTQKQLAEKLYIEHNTYSQYETGKRRMDAQTFFKIASILDIQDFNKEVMMSLLNIKIPLYVGIGLKEITIDELRDLKKGTIFDLGGKFPNRFPLLAGNDEKDIVAYGHFEKLDDGDFFIVDEKIEPTPFRKNKESMSVIKELEIEIPLQEIEQLQEGTKYNTYYTPASYHAFLIYLGKEKQIRFACAHQLFNTDDFKIRIHAHMNREDGSWTF